MPFPVFSTAEVAEKLGVTFWALYECVRARQRHRIPRPAVRFGTAMVWSTEDIARAKAALKLRQPRRKGGAA
jgi:hypothetical protein